MATPITTILQWWKRYAKPTAEQIAETFRSFRHKDDKVPIADVDGFDDVLLLKADKEAFDIHKNDTEKHITSQEREDWNSKLNSDDFDVHVDNSNIHVTPTEKADFANKKLTIADENGVPQFDLDLPATMSFKGGVFNTSLNQWEISALVPFKVYLSSTGDDISAEPNNLNKPYKTLDAVVAYLATTNSKGVGWWIHVLDNGTYNLTTQNNNLIGLNIYSVNGADILIQNYVSLIIKELRFEIPNGTLNFQYTDDTTTYGDSFFNNSTMLLYQNVTNVIFSNVSSGSATDAYGKMRRGVFRHFGIIDYFNWCNLTIQDDCFGLSDDNGFNKDISIGLIDNYDATSSFGDKPLFSYGGNSGSSFINIKQYNNKTSKAHYLMADKMRVDKITSPNATTFLEYNYFEQARNVDFQNVSIYRERIHIYPKKMIWEGQDFEAIFSHTIQSDILSASYSSFKTVGLGYDYEIGLFFNNFSFKIPSNSLTRYFIAFDLRSGRKGIQTVLSNGIINAENSMRLFAFNNYTNTGVDYQILFQNSVRLKNNNYLVSGNVPSGVPNTVLVQENACVIHDYGQIHDNSNFQTVITNINTY